MSHLLLLRHVLHQLELSPSHVLNYCQHCCYQDSWQALKLHSIPSSSWLGLSVIQIPRWHFTGYKARTMSGSNLLETEWPPSGQSYHQAGGTTALQGKPSRYPIKRDGTIRAGTELPVAKWSDLAANS